jgi:hypothetical protein
MVGGPWGVRLKRIRSMICAWMRLHGRRGYIMLARPTPTFPEPDRSA